LERLVATKHQATTGGDDQADTIADILLLLPNAPPADAELILNIPARFAARAREAEAAGRDGEAGRFAAVADVLGDLLSGRIASDTTSPQPSAATPPITLASSDPAIATTAATTPDSSDGRKSGPNADTLVRLAPLTSPPEAMGIGRINDDPKTTPSNNELPDGILPGTTPVVGSRPVVSTPTVAAVGDMRSQPLVATIWPRGTPSVLALLAKLEQQITVDYAGPLPSDDQADTIADILLLLPSAPPADAKQVLSTPARLAKRAREAAAAGRYEQASRFAALSDVLEGLLGSNTSGDRAMPKASRQPGEEPSPAAPLGDPVVALAGERDDANFIDHPLTSRTRDGVAVPMSGPVELGNQLPVGEPAGRSNDDRSDVGQMAVAEAPGRQEPVFVAAQPMGSASAAALLAKLEQQITSDLHATLDESDTIADILLLLPNAPPADANLVLNAPARFANRAREAESAGRHDEADRFATLADVLDGLLHGRAPDERAETRPHPDVLLSAAALANPAVPAPPMPGTADSVARAPSDALAMVTAGPVAQASIVSTSTIAPTLDVPGLDASEGATAPSLSTRVTTRTTAEPVGRESDSRPGAAIQAGAEVRLPPTDANVPDVSRRIPPAKQAASPFLPQTETARPPPVPERLRVARLTDSDANANFSGTVSSSESTARRRTSAKAPTAPAERASRVAGPPATTISTATTTTGDPQCRAILQKFSLGEDPSDAERSYLRNGCHRG